MANPFKKNDPRINLKGRPKKGTALTDILNYKLDTKDESGKLQREKIAEMLITLAEGGDLSPLKYLIDRLDDKPKETVELGNGVLETKLLEVFNNG